MGADELARLHEHPRRATARVVDPAPVRLQHLDQHLDDAARGVEFAALLALRARELREEVLVDTTQHVAGTGVGVAHLDIADQVDQLAEPLLVQRRTGVVPRQHVLEHRVVVLDGGHRLIDGQADGRLPRLGLQMRPAGLGWHPEDVLSRVFVLVLSGVCAPLGKHCGMPFFESVRDVLQEDQPEDDVLIFGGIHRAAQRVGHRPQLGFIASRRAAIRGRLHVVRCLLRRSSSCHAQSSLTAGDNSQACWLIHCPITP